MVHAVLSEDAEALKELLGSERKSKAPCNVNIRFKDVHHGSTVASCAIEQRNLDILELLVNTGCCNLNVRVKVDEDVS